MSWAWLEHSLSQQPPSTPFCSSLQPPCPVPSSPSWIKGHHTHAGALCCEEVSQFLGQMLGWRVEAGLVPCSDWGTLVADHGHQQVSRAWQAPSREERWWGQQRFPSSRLFCTAQRSFDLGGVTLIYLKDTAEPSPINSVWFMALPTREREVRTCSPQGYFGGWLSRCVFYCVYCLSDDRN